MVNGRTTRTLKVEVLIGPSTTDSWGNFYCSQRLRVTPNVDYLLQ